MKRILSILFILFIVSSCNMNSSQKIEFVEKENYIFDIEHFSSLMKNSNTNYDALMKTNTYLNLNLHSIEPHKGVEQDNSYIHTDIMDYRFRSEEYTYYQNKLNPSGVEVGAIFDDGKWQFTFYQINKNGSGSKPFNISVSAIESNGLFAYILNCNESEEVGSLLELITNTTYFPYEMYFNMLKIDDSYYSYKFYLIPLDDNFSKQCLIEFNNDTSTHYFDLEKFKQ